MNNNKLQAHSAILMANIIFGLGVPVTKSLLTSWVTPMGYMFLRCIGAALIFWIVSLFMPREKVARRDLVIIMAGGLLGIVVSQSLTAWALKFTTPVYFSLIATLTPIATLIMAVLFAHEKMSGLKLFGVLLGIAGAVLMVLLGSTFGSGSNDVLGISLAVLSVLTWAVYLIITKNVSARYSEVTQMKYVFLISAIATLPWGIAEFPQQKLFSGYFGAESWWGISQMLFIVVFATVLGYFAIPYAMKSLKATTVSIYTNLQPVVASLVAIGVGQDVFSWDKPVAAILVLVSAWLVTQSK